MERDFFGDLPSEITTNILSRLPIRSLAISKSICKLWLNLIDSDDFHKSEIKTPPALALLMPNKDSKRCTIFEIEDDAEKSHDLHYIPLMDLEILHGNRENMEGITDGGLLLLNSPSTKGISVYICNPITREYTELCCPEDYSPDHVFNFGFGASKISGQYKVLGINTLRGSDSEHRVYTLGTGIWRHVEAGVASGFGFHGRNVVCNGNLHWIVCDWSYNMSICGFDVETECFRIFSVPPGGNNLSVLRDCLCCSYTRDNELVIWMMKEYQAEDSWTIEYKLSTIVSDFDRDLMCVDPIIHFKDGDFLMLLNEDRLIYYSNNTRTFQQVAMFRDAAAKDYIRALIFTPSLFSIKNFGFENVISF
ncbi:F-box protein CPR1-like [Salvia hispanica]|uniref:F-box protein CPR1-like n=1 Tax=Salvia hispanica TaxID=49212 RepID=UPI002009B77B|nr:F-box protein CPR1-like [Salvia hispanica]